MTQADTAQERVGLVVVIGGTIKRFAIPVSELLDGDEALMDSSNGVVLGCDQQTVQHNCNVLKLLAGCGLLPEDSLASYFNVPDEECDVLSDADVAQIDEALAEAAELLGAWADFELPADALLENVAVVYTFGML